MIDHRKISQAEDPIVKMMREGSGLWDITAERVELIRGNIDLLSAVGKIAAAEMLDAVDDDQHVWVCKAEYYALLHEIQLSQGKPEREEIQEAVKVLEESSKRDRVDHREWVISTLSLLRRLADAP